MPLWAQFSEICEMMADRMSDLIEMAPFAGWSPTEMEYCRRISAYLGLSVEDHLHDEDRGEKAEIKSTPRASLVRNRSATVSGSRSRGFADSLSALL